MTTVPPPSSLQPIIGAGLIGILLAAPMFGIYSVQVYHYYLRYSKDALWIKSFVYFLWVVLAAQYAVNIHSIYIYLIRDFGQNFALEKADGDFLTYAIFDSVAAVVVQHSFALRLLRIINHPILKWICVVPIVILSWLSLVFGLCLFGMGFKIQFFSDFHTLTWLLDSWLACNVGCDVIITLCMCMTLHKSRTGIKKTDLLINKLIAYSIQTGATTGFVEIFCFATATTSGFHYGHILVIFPLAALYCNSFLSNLLARAPNSPPRLDDSLMTISSPVGPFKAYPGSRNTSMFKRSTIVHQVSTVTRASAEFEYELEDKPQNVPRANDGEISIGSSQRTPV